MEEEQYIQMIQIDDFDPRYETNRISFTAWERERDEEAAARAEQ